MTFNEPPDWFEARAAECRRECEDTRPALRYIEGAQKRAAFIMHLANLLRRAKLYEAIAADIRRSL